MKLLILTALLGFSLCAQEQPAPAPPASSSDASRPPAESPNLAPPAEPKVHKLSDTEKLKFAKLQLRMAPLNAEMAQISAQARAVQKDQGQIQAEWDKTLAEVRKEMKCPTCQLNADTDLEEPAKPAEKK